MTQPPADLLGRIEALYNAGKRQEARLLLLEYLKFNLDSARAWWLMSQVVTEISQKIDSLQRVLTLEPGNEAARQQLEFLKTAAGQPSAPPFSSGTPQPLSQEKAAYAGPVVPPPAASTSPFITTSLDSGSLPALADGSQPGPAGKPKKKLSPLARILAVGLGILVLVGLVVLLSRYMTHAAASRAESLRNTRAVAAFLTALPTNTSAPTSTIPPTETSVPVRPSTSTPNENETATPFPTDQVGLQPGNYAPAFSLADASTGQFYTPGQFSGQSVLLFFCNTTSAECHEELDTLKAIHQNYQARGLVILGIDSGEDPLTVNLYRKSEQLGYFVLVDLDDAVRDLYQIETTPTYYLIESNGKINAVHVGILSYTQLDTWLREILP